MSRGIKLYPTRTGFANFDQSNEGWTAETGASINSSGTTIGFQTELRLISGTTLVGARSPETTLVGSLTAVRAEALYKTSDSSQTFNLSILDQGDTLLASTNFVTSAYSTGYNDYKRAVVSHVVGPGVTGVYARVCQGNDIDGAILVNDAAINESVILMDPDNVSRRLSTVRSTHATLSGRKVVDVMQRQYSMSYDWAVMTPEHFNRLQEFFYRGEALRLDDGEVPDNIQNFPIYGKGLIDYSNASSIMNYPSAGSLLYMKSYGNSLQPDDAAFKIGTGTSLVTGQLTDAYTTTGASITTTSDSLYAGMRFHYPTMGSSYGPFDSAWTFNVDVTTEINSTGVGLFGFDVWIEDKMEDIWRRIQTVARVGYTNVVIDLRSTDLLEAVRDPEEANGAIDIMFTTRGTNRGNGTKLTFRNAAVRGNHGFDWSDTEAQSMGGIGTTVVNFLDKPKGISYVLHDAREAGATSSSGLTTLTAGEDYVMRPDGLALAMPSPNITALANYHRSQMLVRYSRDFLVHIEALPETFIRTGDTTARHRSVSMQLSTLRSSVEERLIT
jgi:hypothetical protein